MIPISLRVNIDCAKLVYSWRIHKDSEMQNCQVRNSTLPEELGRIQHLLCDKTGTLTQNIMNFKSISSTMSVFNQENLPELKNYVENNIRKSESTCSEYPLQDKKDKFAV